MKKKGFIVTIIIALSLVLTGCFENKKTDAMKFKEDYEALNNKEVQNSEKKYRAISIDKNNPIVYSSFKDVYDRINNNETFLVYVGFSACPWCRSVIQYIIEEANNTNVDKIYYINVREDNTKASDLRGYYKLDDNDKVVIDIYPDKYYHAVLNTLDEFLSPFTLTNKNGKKIETGENRLYAPTLILYKNGKATLLDECISEDQEDGYEELTENMINYTRERAKKIFNSYNQK